MKKRKFIRNILLTTGILASPISSDAKDSIKGKFVHTVLFWLKPEVNVEGFVNGTRAFLDKVSVIKSYHVGTPAMTPREVVDNSYSVCLVVTFANKEDQDIYQKHQAHLDYVEERKNDWNRVQIYDSIEYVS